MKDPIEKPKIDPVAAQPMKDALNRLAEMQKHADEVAKNNAVLQDVKREERQGVAKAGQERIKR